jgi:hypothetical protein
VAFSGIPIEFRKLQGNKIQHYVGLCKHCNPSNHDGRPAQLQARTSAGCDLRYPSESPKSTACEMDRAEASQTPVLNLAVSRQARLCAQSAFSFLLIRRHFQL